VTDSDADRLLRDLTDRIVRAAGFVFATADLAGLRSGSMNALLPPSVVHPAG
jgi:hypothetical protein